MWRCSTFSGLCTALSYVFCSSVFFAPAKSILSIDFRQLVFFMILTWLRLILQDILLMRHFCIVLQYAFRLTYCSTRLRRVDFRYTTILVLTLSYISCFFVPPASRFQIHNDTCINVVLYHVCRASGEAILDTQRYLYQRFRIQIMLTPPARRFSYIHTHIIHIYIYTCMICFFSASG